MRAAHRFGNDPWPHEMTLTVADCEQPLLDLLWVRERYGLAPSIAKAVPAAAEVEAVPPSLPPLRRDEGALEAAWTRHWNAALERFAPPVPTAAAPPTDEQVAAVMAGSSWRPDFGPDAFGEAYDAWLDRLEARRERMRPRSFDAIPERRSVDALVVAWRRGLETVVTIPSDADYAWTIGPKALLVSDSARQDPDAYGRALAAFPA